METNYKTDLVRFFILGVCAGIPFLLIASTLIIWLQDHGNKLNIISIISWCTLPYALKFLWAPIFDLYKVPWLSRIIGNKKSWLIIVQLLLATLIYLLGTFDPNKDLNSIILLSFLISIFSSSQDLLIEGYRIENFNKHKRFNLVIGADVCGFRTGMMISTTLPLYIASYYSWSYAFKCISAILFLGILNTISCKEPLINQQLSIKKLIKTIKTNMSYEVICVISLFILSFKSIDIVISNFIKPYFFHLGFSKIFIADNLIIYGSLLAIGGTITISKLLEKYSLSIVFKYTIIGEIICCFFLQFLITPYSNRLLILTVIGITSFISGGHQVVLWNILTKLTIKKFSATYFALFTSISAFSRIIITNIAGAITSVSSIEIIYTVAALGAIPSYYILKNKLSLQV